MSSVNPTAGAAELVDIDQDRPVPLVDGESAAWTASLLIHLIALTALTVASLALPDNDSTIDLALQPLDAVVAEELSQEFVSSDQMQDDIGALATGGQDGALASAPEFSEQSLVIHEADLLDLPSDRVAVDLELQTDRGPENLTPFAVQGAGSVGTTGAEGAIDRLTHEILASLEQRPTMVVWLFDESGSLKAERAKVVKRFRRIYEELGVIEAADNPAFRKHKDKPLLTAVVGFGAGPRMYTPDPTDRIEDIEAAVKRVEDDETGQENVFQAVAMVAEKFRSYRSAKNGKRHVMIVVFTDEAGDDAMALDDTVDICRKYAMPVHVVGRPAPFGRQTAYVKWIDPDPKFDQRPQWAPVTLGPESLMPELLKLRFAQGGDEEELLDSGFGPYALTRLCYETGGIYFAAHPNRVVGRRVSGEETNNLSAHFAAFFDAEAMRRYQPDYVPVQEYMRLLQTNRARGSLIRAAEMTWTSPMENVRLRFPKRDEAELAQLLSIAQRSAAILQPKLNAICEVLLAGEEDRPGLKEPRWQAGYDLALGRALAVKVRTDGYNVMLAEAKQGMPFKEANNNTWILRPTERFAASGLEKMAAKARSLLEGVVEDHPGTPWAMLAQRELATPLGWRWDEGYTPLPPVMQQNGNGRQRPRPEPQQPQGPPRRDPPPL
jgi:von Willebrand factor type A domain